MITDSARRLHPRALVVDDELGNPTAEGRAVRALVAEMRDRGIEVIEAASADDGESVVVSDAAIHAILVDWSLEGDRGHRKARALIQRVRSRNDKVPIFLLAERGEAHRQAIEPGRRIPLRPPEVDQRREQPMRATLRQREALGDFAERHVARAVGEQLDDRKAAFGGYMSHDVDVRRLRLQRAGSRAPGSMRAADVRNCISVSI